MDNFETVDYIISHNLKEDIRNTNIIKIKLIYKICYFLEGFT